MGDCDSAGHVAEQSAGAKLRAAAAAVRRTSTNNTVARYNWITPDQYNDMHSALNTDFTYNGVTYQAGTDAEQIALGDNFLSIIVPEIEASQAFKNNGEIVIWNDETEGDEDADRPPASPAPRSSSRRSPRATPTRTTSSTHTPPIWSRCRTSSGSPAAAPAAISAASGGANSLADLFKPGVIPSAIPEPSTWVMMGLGFAGLAGAAAYRRKLGAAAKPAAAC